MWRLVLLISIFPLLIAWVCYWWFGLRVLAMDGSSICKLDLNRWFPHPEGADAQRAEDRAFIFGSYLRRYALEQQTPEEISARKSVRRFGMAVPPLSILIAVFAVLLAKITILWGLVIVIGATAFACTFGILAVPKELRAVARMARKVREARSFPRADDEDAVIRCAIAQVWLDSLPPVLRWLQGGR